MVRALPREGSDRAAARRALNCDGVAAPAGAEAPRFGRFLRAGFPVTVRASRASAEDRPLSACLRYFRLSPMLSLNPFQPHSRRAVGAWLSRARAIGVLLPLALPLVASAGGPLSRDPALTFGILLRQSLTRAPEYVALAARDDEARAHLEAGRAWLAGRPSLEASYLDDRGRSGAGVSELEYGVQLPLWRPGERRDAAAFGREIGRAHV